LTSNALRARIIIRGGGYPPPYVIGDAMPFQDIVNGGVGIFFMVREAIDGSRRHREMASAARDLADKVGAVATSLPVGATDETQTIAQTEIPSKIEGLPTTQEGIKQRLRAAKAVSHLSTEDTIRYQNREIGKQLVALEYHLAQRMRIQGVPCDCGSSKHLLFLEQLSQETIPMTGNPSDYEAIILWVREIESKCTEEGAKSGRYDEEYPVMASQARDFRKRVLGSESRLAMVE